MTKTYNETESASVFGERIARGIVSLIAADDFEHDLEADRALAKVFDLCIRYLDRELPDRLDALGLAAAILRVNRATVTSLENLGIEKRDISRLLQLSSGGVDRQSATPKTSEPIVQQKGPRGGHGHIGFDEIRQDSNPTDRPSDRVVEGGVSSA